MGLIKKAPGLGMLLILEFLLLLIVSYQIQVDNHMSLLEKGALALFAPFQEANKKAVDSVSKRFADRRTREELELENSLFRKKLEDRERVVTELVEVSLENERLRALLNLPKEENWNYVPAQVIGSNHRRNDYMITINKGEKDGIRRDYGVFCPDGVVGVVWEVSGGYAKVLTANNPSAVTAAMLQDGRDSEIFVAGRGTAQEAFGSIENFPNFKAIHPTDLVLTAGLDGVFPKGLHIGRVIRAQPSSYMFQNVEIRFSTDFSRLEEVVVLVPNCPEDDQ